MSFDQNKLFKLYEQKRINARLNELQTPDFKGNVEDALSWLDKEFPVSGDGYTRQLDFIRAEFHRNKNLNKELAKFWNELYATVASYSAYDYEPDEEDEDDVVDFYGKTRG